MRTALCFKAYKRSCFCWIKLNVIQVFKGRSSSFCPWRTEKVWGSKFSLSTWIRLPSIGQKTYIWMNIETSVWACASGQVIKHFWASISPTVRWNFWSGCFLGPSLLLVFYEFTLSSLITKWSSIHGRSYTVWFPT